MHEIMSTTCINPSKYNISFIRYRINQNATSLRLFLQDFTNIFVSHVKHAITSLSKKTRSVFHHFVFANVEKDIGRDVKNVM